MQLISGYTRPIITNFWIYLYLCIGHSNLPSSDQKKRRDEKGQKKGRFFELFFKVPPFFLNRFFNNGYKLMREEASLKRPFLNFLFQTSQC